MDFKGSLLRFISNTLYQVGGAYGRTGDRTCALRLGGYLTQQGAWLNTLTGAVEPV